MARFSNSGINAEDLQDTGSMILAIVRNMINSRITLPFLAQVTAISKNRVDVKMLAVKTDADDKMLDVLEILDVPVGLPYTGKWSVTMPIQKDDIGLCIVCNTDISGYKQSGEGGVPPTKRRFDPSDCIFLPLSMYKQPEIKEDLVLTSTDEKTLITLKDEGVVEVTAGDATVNLKSITTTVSAAATLNVGDKIEGTFSAALTLTVKGAVKITCQDAVTIEAQSSATVKSGEAKVELSSSGAVLSNGQMKVECTAANVAINGQNLTVM